MSSALKDRIDDADHYFADALAAAEKQRYVPKLALTYNLRGIALRRQGRLEEAERSHRLALALYHERGVPVGLALALASLGYIEELRGNAPMARTHHAAALRAACDTTDRRSQALAVEGLAGVASLSGDARAVGVLLGVAAALRDASGGPLMGAERADIARAEARVAGHAGLQPAFAEGYENSAAVLEDTRERVAGALA